MIAPMDLRRVLALTVLATLSCSSFAETLTCGTPAPDASRIAVAGGSLTEILFALGEQERIVAVDRTATYPEAALDLPQIGYVRAIAAEGVLSLEPTLVLGEHDLGPPEVVEQLTKLGIDMLIVPEAFSVDGIRDKIHCVAAAVGAEAAGAALADSLLQGVSLPHTGTLNSAGVAPKGIVLLGLRSGAPVAAGAETSGDGLLAMAGADNLMTFAGWKPLSVEAMAAASPQFIVIPERGIETAGGLDALLEHPALRLTPAAKARRVISMDGMAMLGFGPRTVEAAAKLRQQLIADELVKP